MIVTAASCLARLEGDVLRTDVISWHACILAAAAIDDGQAVFQTSTGQLLLYDAEAGSNLQLLGSFAEPCPEMHPLPLGDICACLQRF